MTKAQSNVFLAYCNLHKDAKDPDNYLSLVQFFITYIINHSSIFITTLQWNFPF